MQPFKLPHYSLSIQISLAVVSLSLLIIIGIGTIVIILVRNTLENHILTDRQRVAQGVAQRLEGFLAAQRDQMQLVFDESLAGSTLEDRLALTLVRNPALLELAVVSEGEVVANMTQNGRSILNETSPSNDWEEKVTPYISSLRFSPQHQPYVILSQMADETYIIAARLDAWAIWDVINQDKLSRYEHTYVIDTDGALIVDTSFSPEAFNLPATLRDVQHPFSGQYVANDGDKVLGATDTIVGTNWLVVNEISTEIAFEEVRQIIFTILLLLACLAGLTLIVGHLLAKQITHPLQQISNLLERVKDGQYTRTVQLQGPVELKMLMTAFNHMEQAIAEREIELRTANAALTARTDELRTLSRQIIAVKEEEQRRISREIHDGFAQTLTALKMLLDVALRISTLERKDELLTEAAEIVEHAIDEAHAISENLRPTVLDDLGLHAAIEWYLERFRQHFGLEVDYEYEQADSLRLDAECEITAYRFLQEALSNIHKHAAATAVTIKIRQQANYAMLAIRDNGQGFDYASQQVPSDRLHLGLSGLRERLTMMGGELIVHSAIGSGTTLIALLPIHPN